MIEVVAEGAVLYEEVLGVPRHLKAVVGAPLLRNAPQRNVVAQPDQCTCCHALATLVRLVVERNILHCGVVVIEDADACGVAGELGVRQPIPFLQ